MEFTSKAQAKFMFAKHPELAKEFAAKTVSIKALPERAPSGKYNRRKPVMPAIHKG